jgi:hypothetical protein
MGAPTEFELEGRRFEVKRLSVDDACMSLEVLGKALGPAAVAVLGGEAPDYGKVLTALLSNASQLSVLLKLYLPVSKFDRAGNGVMVDLKPFSSEVFGGRVDLMVAFLAQAVRAEHACFLGGPNVLAELVQELVGTASASPTAPTA